MPQFLAREVKTARVIMRNPAARAFDYHAVLYMGVNQVAMAENDFSLNAGESKEVNISVTMPSQTGTYPVYLSVFSAGKLLAHYQATESVTITSAPWTLSDPTISPPGPLFPGSPITGFIGSVVVKNTANVAVTKIILSYMRWPQHPTMQFATVGIPKQLTLGPGQSATVATEVGDLIFILGHTIVEFFFMTGDGEASPIKTVYL